MNCVPFELSTGAITLIVLVAFWLGLCFIAGMRAFGKATIDEATAALKIVEHLKKE